MFINLSAAIQYWESSICHKFYMYYLYYWFLPKYKSRNLLKFLELFYSAAPRVTKFGYDMRDGNLQLDCYAKGNFRYYTSFRKQNFYYNYYPSQST